MDGGLGTSPSFLTYDLMGYLEIKPTAKDKDVNLQQIINIAKQWVLSTLEVWVAYLK
jgi:hypothetical protein